MRGIKRNARIPLRSAGRLLPSKKITRTSLATQIRLPANLFSPDPQSFTPDLIFLFSTNYFSTPRGYLEIKKSFTLYARRLLCCWRREWDLNPRAPKGHRLTGEPIPDMGPRARQTARYQAPESRLNWATFHRLFSLFGKRARSR